MLKNKKIRTILIGALMVCAMGSTIFAKSISETAEIFYNNIKIYIDGAEIVPKDANGNTIEPFTMNGTTYLPIRAISNAFGQDVEWDGATQSIYIGKKDQTKPDNYLDRINHTAYNSEYDSDNFYIINGTITDFNNVDYTNGILFYRGYSGGFSAKIDYPINLQYKKLTGKVVLPQKINIAGLKNENALNGDAQIDKIEIYGDGKLIKSIPKISVSNTYSFEVDVTGVAMLSIKVIRDKDWNSYYCAITDLALYK